MIDILHNNSYVSLALNNRLCHFDSFHIHNHQILPLFSFNLPFHLLVLALHLSYEIFHQMVSYSLLLSFLMLLINLYIFLVLDFLNTSISYHNKLMFFINICSTVLVFPHLVFPQISILKHLSGI